MINILIIQENGHHDANRIYRECYSFQRAFQEMENVSADVWGNRHANFSKKPDFDSYDIILQLEQYDGCYGQSWVPHEEIKKSKAFKVLWSVDSHVRGAQYYEDLREKGAYDLVLNTIKHHIGPKGIWFPNAYDDTLIKPLRVDNILDVGFCGCPATEKRQAFLQYLKMKLGSSFRHDAWILGDEMVRTINSYRIHFNFNIADDINYRSFETLGCGIPLLTNYNYQYEELGFIHGENCLMYKTPDEAVELCKTYLADPVAREKIGAAGLILAREHSYRARARQLLSSVSSIHRSKAGSLIINDLHIPAKP